MCTTICPLHLFLRDFENQRSDILRKTEPRSETDTSSVSDSRDGSKLKYFEATPALSPTVSHQLVLCSLAMGDFTGAFQKQPLCDFFDMTIYFAAHSIFLTFRSKQGRSRSNSGSPFPAVVSRIRLVDNWTFNWFFIAFQWSKFECNDFLRRRDFLF